MPKKPTKVNDKKPCKPRVKKQVQIVSTPNTVAIQSGGDVSLKSEGKIFFSSEKISVANSPAPTSNTVVDIGQKDPKYGTFTSAEEYMQNVKENYDSGMVYKGYASHFAAADRAIISVVALFVVLLAIALVSLVF